ncbi:hypothetical protein ACF0H5_021789 [Mactra antiquata]
MNYYEQFYDDLEFESDDAYYGRRDPPRYPRDDPYRGDPYRDSVYRDDPYFDDDPRYHHTLHHHDYEYERDRYMRNMEAFDRRETSHPDEYGVSRGHIRDRGHHYRDDLEHGYDRTDRHFEDDRFDRGRGHGDRGRGRGDRGRGRGDWSRGRGRGQRGHGNEDQAHDSDDSGQNTNYKSRGRGLQRGPLRGGIKPMNFVKGGSTGSDSQTESSNSKAGNSDQIRFDFKQFQNEPSQVEKEVEQALKAYKCQLGNGYGYGPREDLIDREQHSDWNIDDNNEMSVSCSTSETSNDITSQSAHTIPQTEVNTAPRNNVKTAMINPAFNFVKAKSEFHSIDVAFHETEKIQEEQPVANKLSVNFGNKRVGLGYGVSANKGNVSNKAVADKFYAGLKDGCNAQMDAKFSKLQQSVKLRNLPNKNGIEILHMAVDKVKMVINDNITSGGRTYGGQPLFLCKLLIDGVFIAEGQATAKKAAKHEAYSNALKVFNNDNLTVKEVSKDVLELRPKEFEFKMPGPAVMQLPARKLNTLTPGSKSGLNTNTTVQSMTSVSNNSQKNAQINQPIYSKPKIVFHQPSHPLNNEPLEFKPKQVTSTSPQQHGTKNAEALAIKLLNFVKEGQSDNQEKTASDLKQDLPHKNTRPLNLKSSPRKRPSQMLDPKRVKSQRMGKSDNFNSLDDLSDFILVDTSFLVETNDKFRDVKLLHDSANFNRVILKVEYEDNDDDSGSGMNCSLVLADIVVSTSHGSTKEEAKLSAAKDALEYLRECCYTIIVKQQVDSDVAGLTKEQLLSDIQKSEGSDTNTAIPNSNIGNLLLRKMGWIGGGVGKDGKGIAEPVKTEMVIGREGLGLQAEKGIGKNFHNKVTKLLQDYIKSDDQRDLHFSSELSKDERAIIHKIGQKLGLKTQSKGSKVIENDRCLIVSRKRSAKELLEHIKVSGGSTSKYELIPPNNLDFAITRREDIIHSHSKQ